MKIYITINEKQYARVVARVQRGSRVSCVMHAFTSSTQSRGHIIIIIIHRVLSSLCVTALVDMRCAEWWNRVNHNILMIIMCWGPHIGWLYVVFFREHANDNVILIIINQTQPVRIEQRIIFRTLEYQICLFAQVWKLLYIIDFPHKKKIRHVLNWFAISS